MSHPLFNEPPHLELLQWLARGSLKQNLLRAIRLWVWLCCLYGDDRDRLPLPYEFTYPQWRDAFFSESHPKGESIPDFHDHNCLCKKTTAEWIFAAIGVVQSEWQRSLQKYADIPDPALEQILQTRLFAVTRRSLQGDLHVLTQLGWLDRHQERYARVQKFPSYPAIARSQSPLNPQIDPDREHSAFVNLDLRAIAENLSQPIAGTQRFFLELDYIISQNNLDRVEDWQEQLKELWKQPTIQPVRLSYNSAKLGVSVKCIVYPVCLYYVRRAIYLCAFGQTPNAQGTWYNYRLDRIRRLTPLAWTDTNIPQLLLQHFQQKTLPTPDYIQEQMDEAWGFDFYLPKRSMVLRFVREFHDRYIQGTFRHPTFQSISYYQAEQLIQKHADPKNQQELLTVLRARDRQDAYYHIDYRHGDTNVGMRLRAWRPNSEVLLPWELRQKIAQEVQQEFTHYASLHHRPPG